MLQQFVEFQYIPGEGLVVRIKPWGMSLIPEASQEHLRTANKEFLLALRSCLDRAIEGVEQRGKSPRRPRRVQVKGEE